MASVRLVYLCERTGLPGLDAQRSALRAAGITDAELADPYVDRWPRKPKPGEELQPARTDLTRAVRKGDEVWVARLGVLATTQDEALAFVIAITKFEAVLRDAATGGTYSVPAKAKAGVEAGLALARAIAADERAAVMERARRGKDGKTGGRRPIDPKVLKKAKALWDNHDISGDEAAKRAAVSKRTLARYFGKRNTPAFGKALNMRRGKQ